MIWQNWDLHEKKVYENKMISKRKEVHDEMQDMDSFTDTKNVKKIMTNHWRDSRMKI